MNKKNVLIGLASFAVAVLAFLVGVGAGAATPMPINSAAPAPVQYDPTPSPAFLTYTAPAAEPTLPAGTIAAGTYVVGEDIQPGTYKTTGPTDSLIKSCYWERMKNLDGGFDAIAANDNITGPGVLTVKPGDKGLKLSGSCTWVKK